MKCLGEARPPLSPVAAPEEENGQGFLAAAMGLAQLTVGGGGFSPLHFWLGLNCRAAKAPSLPGEES